jgi:hypothetical protein
MGYEQVDQKILVIEMAIAIKLPFFNGPNFVSIFFPHKLLDLGRLTTTKVWISQPKNPSH